MHILCRRAIYRVPILTLAITVTVILIVYIHDFIKSSNVEYVPVLQIAEDELRKFDFAGVDVQDILFYNRVPKTGSSSMESMLTKLQVCTGWSNRTLLQTLKYFMLFDRSCFSKTSH